MWVSSSHRCLCPKLKHIDLQKLGPQTVGISVLLYSLPKPQFVGVRPISRRPPDSCWLIFLSLLLSEPSRKSSEIFGIRLQSSKGEEHLQQLRDEWEAVMSHSVMGFGWIISISLYGIFYRNMSEVWLTVYLPKLHCRVHKITLHVGLLLIQLQHLYFRKVINVINRTF